MTPYAGRLLLSVLIVLFPATLSAGLAATQGNLDGFDAFMANALENYQGAARGCGGCQGWQSPARERLWLPSHGQEISDHRKDTVSDRIDYEILHRDGARYAR